MVENFRRANVFFWQSKKKEFFLFNDRARNFLSGGALRTQK